MKKIIWVKKPKCAGTSIEAIFQQEKCIHYVSQYTTLNDLMDQKIKVICIRDGAANRSFRNLNEQGAYFEDFGTSLYERVLTRFNIGFEPINFAYKNFGNYLSNFPAFGVIRNPYDKFVSSWRYLKGFKNHDVPYVLKNMPSKYRNFHDWLHMTKTQHEAVHYNSIVVVNFFIYMEQGLDDQFEEILDYLEIKTHFLPHNNRSKKKMLPNH